MTLKKSRFLVWLLGLAGLLLATTLAPATTQATSGPQPSILRHRAVASSGLPIYVTAVGATFSELSLSSDASTVTQTGMLTFTVSDQSGLNPGWVARASSTDFSANGTVLTIPASDLSVTGLPVLSVACSGVCGAGQPVPSSVGATFDTNPAVAVECPAPASGTGTYTVSVPFQLTATGTAAQLLQDSALTFVNSFSVSLTIGADAGDYSAYGCGSSGTDTTPPTVSCGSPDTAWHATDVAIPCTASDSGSGLANPADASFTLSTTVPMGTETADATTASRSVCDVAGNCTTAGPISGIKVDKKAPSISITTPTTRTYLLHQAVPAAYACTDGGSGVATCAGPVVSGATIDTASVGTKSFTVAATDAVSNTASQAIPYRVAYSIHPVAVVTGTGTVLTALQLRDAQQANVSSPSILVRATSIDGHRVTPAWPVTANARFLYAPHLGGTGGYILVVRTAGLASGWHVLTVAAGADPTIHTIWFHVS